jgi:DNA-binding transcriptional ArsR family regulator
MLLGVADDDQHAATAPGNGAPPEAGEEPPAAGRAPSRELRDPRELRALAHPVRLEILEQLMLLGPSTATEMSEHLQTESPANCSWHLRQLARYGFVEEAGTGPGRQRRWRLVPQSTRVGSTGEEPELVRAADALNEVMLGRELAAVRAWQASSREEDPQWREASFTLHSQSWLTAAEMAAFQAEFMELFARHPVSNADRLDPANRPPGARPARLVTWLVPQPTPGAPGGDDPSGRYDRMADDS